jgi:hypothetical protein
MPAVEGAVPAAARRSRAVPWTNEHAGDNEDIPPRAMPRARPPSCHIAPVREQLACQRRATMVILASACRKYAYRERVTSDTQDTPHRGLAPAAWVFGESAPTSQSTHTHTGMHLRDLWLRLPMSLRRHAASKLALCMPSRACALSLGVIVGNVSFYSRGSWGVTEYMYAYTCIVCRAVRPPGGAGFTGRAQMAGQPSAECKLLRDATATMTVAAGAPGAAPPAAGVGTVWGDGGFSGGLGAC